MNIATQLKKWREKKGFSQADAAAYLEISKRTLQDWEQGRRQPVGLARRFLVKLIGGKLEH